MRQNILQRVRRAGVALVLGALAVAAGAQTPGTVRAWGYKPKFDGVPNVRAVATGGFGQILLMADGSVQSADLLLPPGLGNGFTAVVCGYTNALALKADGSVATWGRDNFGAGLLHPPDEATHDVTAIATGYNYCAVLKSDGTVVTWGKDLGALPIPPEVQGHATAIASGANLMVALLDNQHVACWGNDPILPYVIESAGLSGITAISAGNDFVVALKSDGHIVTVGPDGSMPIISDSPVEGGFTAVAAGINFALGLKADGTVVAWGENNAGQTSVPTGLHGVKSIWAGFGVSASAIWAPDPPAPFTGTISTSVNTIIGGSVAPVTGTLTLPTATANDLVVALSSSDPAVVLPATVTIPAHKKTVKFAIGSTWVPTSVGVNLMAGDTANTSVTVLPLTIAKLAISPATTEGGQNASGTVTLNATVSSPVTVTLSSSDPSANPDATVVVQPGSKSGTFTIHTSVVAASMPLAITATLGGSTGSATLTLLPLPIIASVTLAPSMYGNQTITGTVLLRTVSGSGGADISFAADAGLTVPVSIHIMPGQKTATFTVTAGDVSALTSYALTVSNPVSAVGVNVKVKPLTVTSIVLAPSSVVGGNGSTAIVTLNTVVDFDTVFELTFSNGVASSNDYMIVRAGSSAGYIGIQTNGVTKLTKVTVTASKNGKSQKATLTVTKSDGTAH